MKNPLWKQATPTDQLTVIRGSLEGHVDNWVGSILFDLKFIVVLREHLEQIRKLEPFLKGLEIWYETPLV